MLPAEILEKCKNRRISLLLKDNRILEGKLSGYDEYMNLVLEGTKEDNAGKRRKLGLVILRGNNVVSISPK